MSDGQITELQDDVKALRKWTGRHEERHGDDADMLQRVLNHLDTHDSNHHGRVSEIKRGASIITILAILAGAVEVMRQFIV